MTLNDDVLPVLQDASIVIEDLLYLLGQFTEAYGYGISNETHDRAMAALGSLDSLRSRISTPSDWHHAAARYIDEE